MQVAVDGKLFNVALEDYSAALAMTNRAEDTGRAARLLAGRALAYEGLYAWPLALADDDEALRLAAVGGMARWHPRDLSSLGSHWPIPVASNHWPIRVVSKLETERCMRCLSGLG